jgi:hypothetical protein
LFKKKYGHNAFICSALKAFNTSLDLKYALYFQSGSL